MVAVVAVEVVEVEEVEEVEEEVVVGGGGEEGEDVHYVTFSIFGSLERRHYTHIRLYAPSVSLSLVSGERRMSLHVRGQSSSIVARSTPRSFAETSDQKTHMASAV